jgi:antitoxin component YwqK of YwqJK toxin-antitoxin module
MIKIKYLYIAFLIILCGSSFSQVLNGIQFKGSSCYKYLIAENYPDPTYSRTDTVMCYSYFSRDSIKIIREFVKGSKVTIKAFYSNGNKYEISTFEKGKRNGVTMTWYKNGNKKGFYYYQFGYKVISIEWYENGEIEYFCEGEQHKGNGFKSINFDSLGNIKDRSYMKDSLNRAIYTKLYYPCSKIMVESIVNDGDHPYVAYHENGNKLIAGNIFQVEFARIGKWQEWYENGILKREYFFNEDIPNQPEGTWKWWDEQGHLIKEEEYKNGELIKSRDYLKGEIKRD